MKAFFRLVKTTLEEINQWTDPTKT